MNAISSSLTTLYQKTLSHIYLSPQAFSSVADKEILAHISYKAETRTHITSLLCFDSRYLGLSYLGQIPRF